MEGTEAKTLDEQMDETLDKLETETPADSSSETKPEGEETTTPESTGAEPVKTEEIKGVEDDSSLSVEDKIAKIGEILGDDEKALDAYVKEKGYHTDPAWIKRNEIIDRLKKELEGKVAMSDEDKAALEDFKKVTSSADYIRASMKEQGFTQDAIDTKLREKGIEVPEKAGDDLQLVAKELNLDLGTLDENARATISDVTKVARVIVNDMLGKVLPNQLKPLQDHIGEMKQSAEADKLMVGIEKTVKDEAILDYKKDVEPELNKWLDANPQGSQEDFLTHFKNLNHSLSIERLKGGKRKEERDVKKEDLRQTVGGTGIGGKKIILPEKTGNFSEDADALLDSLNVH